MYVAMYYQHRITHVNATDNTYIHLLQDNAVSIVILSPEPRLQTEKAAGKKGLPHNNRYQHARCKCAADDMHDTTSCTFIIYAAVKLQYDATQAFTFREVSSRFDFTQTCLFAPDP